MFAGVGLAAFLMVVDGLRPEPFQLGLMAIISGFIMQLTDDFRSMDLELTFFADPRLIPPLGPLKMALVMVITPERFMLKPSLHGVDGLMLFSSNSHIDFRWFVVRGTKALWWTFSAVAGLIPSLSECF